MSFELTNYTKIFHKMLCYRVTCADVTEDSTMLAVGFVDSIVKVWTLVPQKLKTMKSAEQLQDINIEAEDVLVSTLKLYRRTFLSIVIVR